MFTHAIISSGLTRAEFAGHLRISTSYLSLLESGKKRPSLTLAFQIERLTQGAVPAASWIPEPPKEDAA